MLMASQTEASSALQIFQPVLAPRLLPQELQRYDPLSAKLQPLVLGGTAQLGSCRWPDSLLFPARSTECLSRCHRKRCVPNPGKCLPDAANAQNSDAWRVQSDPMSSGPLQQDYAQTSREPLPNSAPGLMRSYHSASLLVRSLGPWFHGKKGSRQNATCKALQSTDTKLRVR